MINVLKNALSTGEKSANKRLYESPYLTFHLKYASNAPEPLSYLRNYSVTTELLPKLHPNMYEENIKKAAEQVI